MSADVITPAILNYISHSTYPESEEVASATLSADGLSHLLTELQKAQEEAKDAIRSLSKETAPDVDTWISRAKALQDDILRSRETARQIVAEAEAGNDLKAKVEDKANQVGLLEREVAFHESLAGTLEHIRYANGLLERAQGEAVQGNVEKALQRLEDAEASIAGLDAVQGSRAVEVLRQRAERLHESLVEMATEYWNALIMINHDDRWLRVNKEAVQQNHDGAISLDAVVLAVKGLNVFDNLIQKLARQIDRIILRPRMAVNENEMVPEIKTTKSGIACTGASHDVSLAALFKDLNIVLEFLATRLPPSIAVPLSETLIPGLTTRLETQWLDPSIPLSMVDTASFSTTLEDVSALADQIESYGWQGADHLREWIQNTPRTWLTKRREAVLGDVRNLVFSGLRDRKTVERVETQMMKTEVPVASSGNDDGEDEWDSAWDEPEDGSTATSVSDKKPHNEDDDDEASAWEVEDTEEKKDDNEEGDAWGWGDEDNASNQPSSPVATRKAPASKVNGETSTKPGEQEMTLRETFTVTAVPDGILETLQQIVSDAETLAGPEYSSSPLAPASQALYTLPTLALAIYRATAPTAYNKLDVGNMLIYNDAMRLADQLRSWQNSRPAQSRLRLDNDIVALETFAKRAYSSEMESQRTILRDLLDGAQGFSNSTVQPFKSECDNAVVATVDRLRDVHSLWKGILSDGSLKQALGSLLSTVTSKMTSEIEDLGDISEADSKQLKELCDKVTSTKKLFVQTTPAGEEQDMTFVFSPTWLKFQYLAEVLESSLADIRWMWKEGELSLEFEAEEVVELVEALFAESELRRQAIREIRQGR